METLERRHDIDWIRVFAIALLLIYHIAISFQPWGGMMMFLKSNESMEGLWVVMSALNVWRIPLLFFVSGMGVSFAIKRRNWKGLIKERTLRILVPFIFGIFAIVPLHIFVWQAYYKQLLDYTFMPFHLWFLGNIFIYVVVLSPLFFLLKNAEAKEWAQKLKRIFSGPLGLLIMAVVFIAEAELVSPESFETYALTLHGFVLGILAFAFGFVFIYSGKGFWEMIKRYAWIFLAVAFGLYIVRVTVFEIMFAPRYLMSIESNLWVLAVFGLGYKYINKGSATLSYLSQAAYPVYILHMLFLNLSGYFVFGLDIPVELQFVLVVLLTFIGCFATYELLVRRLGFLRPLFGLKVNQQKGSKVTSRLAMEIK